MQRAVGWLRAAPAACPSMQRRTFWAAYSAGSGMSTSPGSICDRVRRSWRLQQLPQASMLHGGSVLTDGNLTSGRGTQSPWHHASCSAAAAALRLRASSRAAASCILQLWGAACGRLRYSRPATGCERRRRAAWGSSPQLAAAGGNQLDAVHVGGRGGKPAEPPSRRALASRRRAGAGWQPLYYPTPCSSSPDGSKAAQMATCSMSRRRNCQTTRASRFPSFLIRPQNKRGRPDRWSFGCARAWLHVLLGPPMHAAGERTAQLVGRLKWGSTSA